MSWISLDEARNRVAGKVEWWKAKGPKGEVVPIKPNDKKGPAELPVRLWENGDMYLGGWKESRFRGQGNTLHGLGVYLSHDEVLTVGTWDRGNKVGLFKESRLPTSACWVANETSLSVLKRQRKGVPEEPKEGVGIPYIYIGKYKANSKDDSRATVVLRDGSTRVGPWKDDKPVGNWWVEHEEKPLSSMDLMKVISFEMNANGTDPMNNTLDNSSVTSPENRNDSSTFPVEIVSTAQHPKNRKTLTNKDLNVVVSRAPSPDDPQKFWSNLSTWDLPPLDSGNTSRDSDTTTAASRRPQQQQQQQHPKLGKEAYGQCVSICRWLETEVIGYNPNSFEMRRYARRFFDLGFHSVDLIREVCTPEDIESFEWMKPIHKRLFLARAKLKTKAAAEKVVRFQVNN